MSRPQNQNPCSPPKFSKEEIAAKYQEILRDIKDSGYKVVHKKLPKDVAGYYNPDTTGIEIDKPLRNTLDGCFYLLHEFQHLLDHRAGRFKKFFLMELEQEYSDESFALVIEAEMHATREAQKRLKVYGIQYTPQELTEKGYKHCLEFWRKEYFS